MKERRAGLPMVPAWFPEGGRRGHLGPRLEPSLPALLAHQFLGWGWSWQPGPVAVDRPGMLLGQAG